MKYEHSFIANHNKGELKWNLSILILCYTIYEFIIQNDKLISTERIKVSILVLTLCKQINIRLKGILTYPAKTFAENKLN